MTPPRIVTHYDPAPPVPVRRWCAYDDRTYGGEQTDPIGWGETEQEAVADLMEQMEAMTTDPRVKAVAREMHRLEYGGAIDWDADGSLHSAFYLAAEAVIAAADAARPLPADVGGLVRYGIEWQGRDKPVCIEMADGYWTPWHKAAAALTALAERAETAERRLAVATEALRAVDRYNDSPLVYSQALNQIVEPALAEITEEARDA